MRRFRFLLVLGAIVALAGCGQPEGEVASEPSGIPTLTAKPTPQASEPPELGPPALSELAITTEGLDSLVISSAPIESNPVTDIAVYDPTFCEGSGGYRSQSGAWFANYPEVSYLTHYFDLEVDDGVLTRILVSSSPEVATAQGIRLGSSREEVVAAYPDGFAEVVDHAGISDVYVLTGVKGKLLIEVEKDLDGDPAPAPTDPVIVISVVPIDRQAMGIANTGGGPDQCGNS